ncbi:hypothetical protein BO94DRAFT_538503 [Aspergillus sclerotioniger CBS 115572]|uniref:IDI-2 n=1 Tax=Aspergillus sclerotioniger CBS 115572 TaxID=1450535 RepID=A0A317VP24_9EURO|nr:hypothetical protein BO94DRAFT_538503 [Aspergillus sclerotioniger CBS 115572]PWY76124.1 hypothetical protein BO94DRAFT_538503 [Aspergillus sclerotioniger CBS 115572]
MKFTIALFSMLALTSAISSPTAEGAECGDLDIMAVSKADLPEGVSPSDVRKCKDHPLGRNRSLEGASLAPQDDIDPSLSINTTATSEVEARSDLNTLGERSCYSAAPYGCSKGYCWKACGENGEWCWTARKAGVGAWYTCSTYKDCGTTTYACGVGCPSCGCGC